MALNPLGRGLVSVGGRTQTPRHEQLLQPSSLN